MNSIENTPPKIQPKLKSSPKTRGLYWCDFPKDAQLPEFWKRRPVIILSYKHHLHGAVTVVPCTTQEQIGNVWACKLHTSIDGKNAWAICDKITTLAVSRLVMDKSGLKRITEDEFQKVLSITLRWLPKIYP